jgi:hypothetical protein
MENSTHRDCGGGEVMNEQARDPLDTALSSLPRDVAPERDLWVDISARIAEIPAAPREVVDLSQRRAERQTRWTQGVWMRLAAGVLLVVASSLTTYVLTQRGANSKVLQAQQALEAEMQRAPGVAAMPASFGGGEVLGAEYVRARTALDAEFQRQIATLPPVARAKLERNLADLRRAASEISATLAEHPSHPLLQDLLVSTYQSELELLGSVTHLSVPTLNPTSNETRL